MRKPKHLRSTIVNQLKLLYNAEQSLLDTLPQLRAKISSVPLKNLIDRHILHAQRKLLRFEQIFNELDLPYEKVKMKKGWGKRFKEHVSDVKYSITYKTPKVLKEEEITHNLHDMLKKAKKIDKQMMKWLK